MPPPPKKNFLQCRARLLLSGTNVHFVGTKDRETSHLPRSCRIMGWVGGVVTSLSCRASLHLSGMTDDFVTIVNVAVQFLNDPLCWRASQLITG